MRRDQTPQGTVGSTQHTMTDNLFVETLHTIQGAYSCARTRLRPRKHCFYNIYGKTPILSHTVV